MKKIGYLRVSTNEQRPDRQVAGLGHMCDELHIEKISAVATRRPVYERIIAKLTAGDVLVVWDFDRAFRSVEDALAEMRKLRESGIGLEVVGLHVDIATPAGHLLITMLAAASEFERRMLAKRTREGLAAARKRGVRLGRPPKLDDEQLARASRRLAKGDATIAVVAKDLGVAPWSLTRSLRRYASETSNEQTTL